ncbi:MAG: GNAT family N-acetyltransferase [Janthinobacterium lividum]
MKSRETAGVALRLSSPALRISVADCETVSFPAWANYFRHKYASPENDDQILVAQSVEGEIVGTVLLDAEIPRLWSVDEDVRVGSINALGVTPKRRQQGIGLALAAKAMEILQERGCAKCYIQ